MGVEKGLASFEDLLEPVGNGDDSAALVLDLTPAAVASPGPPRLQ